MQVKTSATHPIYVDWIPVLSGKLGLTFCPGKNQVSTYSNTIWRRNLDMDIHTLHTNNVNMVISLVQDYEMKDLGVENLGKTIADKGMSWLWLPIHDGDIPEPDIVQLYQQSLPDIYNILNSGGNIVVHCKGGLGRAGTIASMILLDLNEYPSSNVVDIVRKYRQGAIETKKQYNFIKRYNWYN